MRAERASEEIGVRNGRGDEGNEELFEGYCGQGQHTTRSIARSSSMDANMFRSMGAHGIAFFLVRLYTASAPWLGLFSVASYQH